MKSQGTHEQKLEGKLNTGRQSFPANLSIAGDDKNMSLYAIMRYSPFVGRFTICTRRHTKMPPKSFRKRKHTLVANSIRYHHHRHIGRTKQLARMLHPDAHQ